QHWELFGGIVVVYGVLNIILIQGLSGATNLNNVKTSMDGAFHGVSGKAVSSLASFGYLLATSGSGNACNSGVYQYSLLLVCSLAFIWALRQTIAKNVVKVRESFYGGMYPLIPFLLVFLLIGAQLVPFAIGGAAYSTVLTAGIAVSALEKTLWFLLFV